MDLRSDDSSSAEDLDASEVWKIGRSRKTAGSVNVNETGDEVHCENSVTSTEELEARLQKFKSLQQKAEIVREGSRRCQERTEKRRQQRLLQKAIKDPMIKEVVECKNSDIRGNTSESNEKEKWQDIKPFLTINDHLQGPVSHGDFGPKTELESLIDDAIEEGDFAKAEVLSDTLSNRQFAVKIAHAFKAKRSAEEAAVEEEEKKAKRLKKLPWGFEAKERWQMKGNM